MKIANKISLSFLIVALILTGIAAPTFYLIAKNSLQKAIENNLSTTVTEIDTREAFRSLAVIRLVFLAILFIVPIAAWLSGTFIAGLITGPIQKLHKGAEIIGSGNLDYKVGTDAADEVGQLSRAFDTMMENLRQTTVSINTVNKEIAERERTEENIKKQTQELDAALKDALKSREILSSMLADNNQIREELEKKLQELKQTQDMLVQSEKLASLGALVSDMAHEVNNPLMIVSGRAQLSLMEDLRNKQLEENLHIIMDQCQRAKDIIQRLLIFSKPSKGELKEVNINNSLDFVNKLVEHQYSLSDIKIIRNYSSSLPEVSIDEKQMHEVFMNLLKNSVEAMPKGGTITISTSIENDSIRIDFKDTGCGIPKENLKKIFDPFFTTKEKGTGLGLSVCYGIVKLHGGDIKYESEPGKWTIATVLLPIGGGKA